MTLYNLAVLGAPSSKQLNELKEALTSALEHFEFELGREVGWTVQTTPSNFEPGRSAVVYYGHNNHSGNEVQKLLLQGIPIIPVVSDLKQVASEIPEVLQRFNCLDYLAFGTSHIANALLESIGLLRKQRRVFISYRRDEASDIALQLYAALSARHFQVFLDTHGVFVAEDFQAKLWHHLSNSDVLLMLDTENYFESQWTVAEFGKALAKDILIFRIGWPNVKCNPRLSTGMGLELDSQSCKADGQLTVGVLQKIVPLLEAARSMSYAQKSRALIRKLQEGIEKTQGKFWGVGQHKSAIITLFSGEEIVVYPCIGVPTSEVMHEIVLKFPNCQHRAIIYDHVGLHPEWQTHLNWLDSHVSDIRFMKAEGTNGFAWSLTSWEVQ